MRPHLLEGRIVAAQPGIELPAIEEQPPAAAAMGECMFSNQPIQGGARAEAQVLHGFPHVQIGRFGRGIHLSILSRSILFERHGDTLDRVVDRFERVGLPVGSLSQRADLLDDRQHSEDRAERDDDYSHARIR
jgi:hypothetical protein